MYQCRLTRIEWPWKKFQKPGAHVVNDVGLLVVFPRSHRRKLSLAHKDKPGSKKGKKLTKQQRKRLSEAIKKYWAVNREEYLESIRRGKARGAVERAKRSWDNYRKRKQLKEECSTPLIVPITFRKEHKQMLQMQ